MEKLAHFNNLGYLWDTTGQSCVTHKAKSKIIRILFPVVLFPLWNFYNLNFGWCFVLCNKFIKSIRK